MKRQNKAEPGVRLLRVGENIRHALADILSRDMVRDPDLAGVPITVTQANVSPDLRNATIYIQPLGGKNKEKVVEALNLAAAFLRGQLSSRVRIKYMPKLLFELDGSFDEADHINSLLKNSRAGGDQEEKSAVEINAESADK
jgi:ribosome-binding factor A